MEKKIFMLVVLLALIYVGLTASMYIYVDNVQSMLNGMWKLLDLHNSKQGDTTNLNISFSMKNEKEMFRHVMCCIYRRTGFIA